MQNEVQNKEKILNNVFEAAQKQNCKLTSEEGNEAFKIMPI
jgi:hypothetical protein